MSTISNLMPAPPDNFSTTLNGSITSSSLSITLNSVTNLPSEGIGAIYAKDSEGNITANTLEFIHWTSISSSTLNLTDSGDRGLTGSANGAQAHSSGDTFEVWVVNDYYSGPRSAFLADHSDAGAHDSVTAISNSSDHITLTPGSSKLVKVAVLRQNGTASPANVYTNNTVVLSGWGYITCDNNDRNSKAVTFGITFSEVPIVTISSCGEEASSVTPTSPASFDNPINKIYGFSAVASSTTGFTSYVEQRTTGSANNTIQGFCWVAVGALS